MATHRRGVLQAMVVAGSVYFLRRKCAGATTHGRHSGSRVRLTVLGLASLPCIYSVFSTEGAICAEAAAQARPGLHLSSPLTGPSTDHGHTGAILRSRTRADDEQEPTALSGRQRSDAEPAILLCQSLVGGFPPEHRNATKLILRHTPQVGSHRRLLRKRLMTGPKTVSASAHGTPRQKGKCQTAGV